MFFPRNYFKVCYDKAIVLPLKSWKAVITVSYFLKTNKHSSEDITSGYLPFKTEPSAF